MKEWKIKWLISPAESPWTEYVMATNGYEILK